MPAMLAMPVRAPVPKAAMKAPVTKAIPLMVRTLAASQAAARNAVVVGGGHVGRNKRSSPLDSEQGLRIRHSGTMTVAA